MSPSAFTRPPPPRGAGAGGWPPPDGPGEGTLAGQGPDADPQAAARAICLRLLTAAPRTRAQLADALRRRGVPEDAAEAVLQRFQEVGLIDDEAFAEAWVSSRHAGRGLGRKALAAELRHRGVADETVREAVGRLDPEEELETARRLVARRLPATRGLPTATRTRRLAGMLARKGYPPGPRLPRRPGGAGGGRRGRRPCPRRPRRLAGSEPEELSGDDCPEAPGGRRPRGRGTGRNTAMVGSPELTLLHRRGEGKGRDGPRGRAGRSRWAWVRAAAHARACRERAGAAACGGLMPVVRRAERMSYRSW